jgi:DNA-binding NtrC family response regulator
MIALCDSDEIGVDDLPLSDADEAGGSSSPTDSLVRVAAQRRLSLRELENLYIEEILELTSGNKVQAAKILGIDRKTLYRRAERNSGQAAGEE